MPPLCSQFRSGSGPHAPGIGITSLAFVPFAEAPPILMFFQHKQTDNKLTTQLHQDRVNSHSQDSTFSHLNSTCWDFDTKCRPFQITLISPSRASCVSRVSSVAFPGCFHISQIALPQSPLRLSFSIRFSGSKFAYWTRYIYLVGIFICRKTSN